MFRAAIDEQGTVLIILGPGLMFENGFQRSEQPVFFSEALFLPLFTLCSSFSSRKMLMEENDKINRVAIIQ